jgi:fermentation-respiration switch protein FrsA (DUF1100 family)
MRKLALAAIIAVPIQFPGSLYIPADGHPHPAIVLLHGSEGGMKPEQGREARVLAEQGFAALALCSYGCAGTPAHLAEIDLSRTYEAYRWLRWSPYVRGRPTAVYGKERGAEQALVLAVYLAKHPGLLSPNAVVAHAPTDRIEPGSNGVAAWTWGGALEGLQTGNPIVLDRYSGSLLVTHGIDDEHQSVESSRILERALRGAGSPVRTYLHDRDPAHTPVIVAGPERGPVRADFHYFQGEGETFDSGMDAVRMEWVSDFLKQVLGN